MILRQVPSVLVRSSRVIGIGTAAALCLTLATAQLQAQHPFTPGVAFGAYVFPHVDGNRSSWAVQFDLFTELSKDLDPYPTTPSSDFERYNDIDRTLGFNQIGFSMVRQGPTLGPLFTHLTGWVSGGVVWDAPTEFLQNDAAHGLRLLTYVPREGTLDHAVLGAGGEAMLSYGTVLTPGLDMTWVGGVGGGLSTSYLDGYAQLGPEFRFTYNANLVFSVGAIGRLGLVGDVFPGWDGLDVGLDDRYALFQVFGLLPLYSAWTWFPGIRVAYMHSKGPFTKTGGLSPKTERLFSFRLETEPGHWAVEMWNDVGFKDLGPTFGLRIQWYR